MELAKLVTGREMSEVDRRTIAEAGIAGVELMERAGAEVVAAIAARWDGLAGLQAVVLCGKGNNGGDGFVIARLLGAGGAAVRVFLAAEREAVQGDAAEHLRRYEQEGGVVEATGEDLSPLDAAIAQADLIVDALLGTGLQSAPRPTIARVIERVAIGRCPVVAVDLPSGVESDSGRVQGACVQAALTGHPDIVLGNVVGSNIANTLLIVGASAIILPLVVAPAVARRGSPAPSASQASPPAIRATGTEWSGREPPGTVRTGGEPKITESNILSTQICEAYPRPQLIH